MAAIAEVIGLANLTRYVMQTPLLDAPDCTPANPASQTWPLWGRFASGGGAKLPTHWDSMKGLETKHQARLGGRPSAVRRLFQGKEAQFDASMLEMYRLIAPLLPPRDSAEARTLYVAELETILQMQPFRDEPVFYSSTWPNVTHLALHMHADEFTASTIEGAFHLGGPLDQIGRTLGNASLPDWNFWFQAPYTYDTFDTCTSIVSRLKDAFQRTRPWVVETLLDSPLAFATTDSQSAWTPSLPSGHALQAYCLAGSIIEDLFAVHRGIDWLAGAPHVVESLVRMANDVADHRIIANLHFPSDNFASARVYHYIAPALFPHAEALGVRFARNAAERARVCRDGGYPRMCESPALVPPPHNLPAGDSLIGSPWCSVPPTGSPAPTAPASRPAPVVDYSFNSSAARAECDSRDVQGYSWWGDRGWQLAVAFASGAALSLLAGSVLGLLLLRLNFVTVSRGSRRVVQSHRPDHDAVASTASPASRAAATPARVEPGPHLRV